ncbi:PREDICTED: chaoptin isoform X2 [Nicrophorus vespilloides]|uniref:Chaoptin isoform X2 n=1 Tax=Nicrophorus vespilloides TaxID=110193 RepID=A0ABM1M8M3_NICVS|nr:PREDICTED: chaoptin isoform X2 [Nicrophorus vespilloides]
MDLYAILRFGYSLVIVTFFLMVWTSMIGAKEVEEVRYPPCYFNLLCSCSKAQPDLGIVRCRDIHMPRIPETINNSKVFMLHLENIGLRNLEPFFLQSTGLYKLTVKHNPLTHIPDEAFLGLERSLWELDLSHNQLTKVPNRALRYLQKLRRLDLAGNDISEILPENWRGLDNSLETLDLSDNCINHLPTDAFSGLPILDTIDLRGNHLRRIDPSVFRDGMGKLANLILADNQLSAIPYQALQPLKMLKTLDISYNCINKIQPELTSETQNFNYMMNLNTLRLDYNDITIIQSGAFQYFDVLNKTYLNGNPLDTVEENAFRQAKIRELYMRNCGLDEISPLAFAGLENYLQILDLSGNNITTIMPDMFHRLNLLRTLSLRDNLIQGMNALEVFTGFQYTLYKLDLIDAQKDPISIQDLRRLRNLRFLSLSKLPQPHVSPEDFLDFGVDLEELQIISAGLQSVKNHAFQYVHALRKIDFSENAITAIEPEAFVDIAHSLISLRLSHGFSPSLTTIPAESFKSLVNLQDLDLSNNRLKSMPDTCFHFLKKLRKLDLQDNVIEEVHKGTFQGDIHSNLEEIYLSFNQIKSIQQHTFVDLSSLEQLHLDDNVIVNLERRSFMNLENLKRLNLKGNDINTISYEAFQNLPELEDLDLAYNEMKIFDFSIFDQVGTLAMFSVNMSHNKIADLHVTINTHFEQTTGAGGLHSNIKILDLSYNNITLISKNYFKPAMLSLTHLHMSHNKLFNATRDIFGSLPHLQYLDVSHNRLFEIDFDAFRNTKKLQVFYAEYNFIHELPTDLFKNLDNLRVIDFGHNRLRFLPENMFKFEGLERLDLSHNQINRLPLTSMSVQAAATLCEFDLSWNSIASIAHGGLFERFKSLSWLDLSYNRLVQIDVAVFENLPRLSSLDLSHNTQLVLERNGKSFQGIEDTLLHLGLDNVSLTYVPELPLPNLLSLSLAYNYLPTVPPEMAANISSLMRLNLDYNDLTAVPIVTHSLTNLRELSLASNPITTLTNTSLLGVADYLERLDITNFDLNTLENGAFCKMYSLRSLRMSVYRNVKNFNIPTILQKTYGLRDLEIHIDKMDTSLRMEMKGQLPSKLRNITFTGLALKQLDNSILQGVQSPELNFGLRNTSVTKIPTSLFENLRHVRNLSIELSSNRELQNLENPSTGYKPNLPRTLFLEDIWMEDNKWNCDCQLGWIEVWQRKRRQFLCGQSPSRPPSFKSQDYTCRHINDDLRNSKCTNKNNKSLVDVLKTEIECGWSSGCNLQLSAPLLVLFFSLLLLI